MSLTHKDVTDILKIIDESDIEELVLDVAGAKLVVRRGGAAEAAAQPTVQPTAPVAQPIPAPEAAPLPEVEAPSEPAPAERIPRTDGKIEITAPMVGTFYRQPSPQEPPFVEDGAKVAKGDPLCLIEVMKLYTTIESPVDGTIVEINAENAALVAHDAVLFVIDPA